MSWKKFYFGNETPSLKRQLSVHFTMFFILSSPYAFLGDFDPENWMLYVGGFVSLLVTISFIFYMWTIKDRFSVVMRYGSIKGGIGLAILPIVTCYCSLALTVYTTPAILTAFLGQEVRITGKFDKTQKSAKKSCRYRLSSEMFNNMIPPYICITETQFNREAHEYVILSKKSIFGVSYNAVE